MLRSASNAGVYIAIGSNIAPQSNILKALGLLARVITITEVSRFYWTKALGSGDAPHFLNGVCEAETLLAPRDLKFDVLRPIEAQVGRVRTADRYAPRTIDLDILVYGDQMIDDPDLRVPDPDLSARAFLAVPLFDLAPGMIVPGAGVPLSQIAEKHRDTPLQPDERFTNEVRMRLAL